MVLKLHISENVVENLRNFSDVLKTFRIPHCLTCHVMSDSLVNTSPSSRQFGNVGHQVNMIRNLQPTTS
jgi:hypothetical protein